MKRGESWTVDSSWWQFRVGRSGTERFVLGYYGTSGARPLLRVSVNLIDHNGDYRPHLALIGIDVYNYKLDPNSPDYDAAQTSTVLRLVGSGENLLLEDCLFRFNGLVVQGFGGIYRNVDIRRCIVTDAYFKDSTTSSSDRPSGIFTAETFDLLIEECVWDHNGWNADLPNAGRNIFNHNLYLNTSTANVVVRNNVITRGAAHGLQLRGGGLAEDNLFSRNAVGMNLGYHAADSKYEEHAVASNNVILHGQDMDPGDVSPISSAAVWGIWTSRERFLVENNIVANRLDSATNIAFPDDNGAVTDYVNNTVYQWDPSVDSNNPNWIDPERSLASYHASLGKTASFEAFIAEARSRPLGDWPSEYEAKRVNDYFREGFSESGNQNPTVSFTHSSPGNQVPVTVNFSASTHDDDGDLLSYAWKLEDTWFYPDGTSRLSDVVFGTSSNLSHTYTYPGTYRVSLTVYDGRGGSATHTQMITIGGNYPPVAQFTSNVTSGDGPLTIEFDASSSFDENGDLLYYTYDFGDGNSLVTTDSQVSHTYPPGDYVATMRVFDGITNSITTESLTLAVADPTTAFADYVVQADASLEAENASTNFGSVFNSRVTQSDRFALFRVNYGANTNQIIRAGLRLENKFGSEECGVAHVADDSWNESVVTWTNRPASGAEISRATPNGDWIDFDVTTAATSEVDKVLSLLVYAVSGGWQEFRHRETPWSNPHLRLETKVATANQTPQASLVANIVSGDAPLTVEFDASASMDGDSHPLTYVFDFGDGNTASGSATPQHTFTRGGVYLVTVIVDDGQGTVNGSRAIQTMMITVNDTPRSLFDAAAEAAGLTSTNADPDAIPFGDGVTNLFKFATNMDLTGTDLRTMPPGGAGDAGLPAIYLDTSGGQEVLRFEFVRRLGAGLNYAPQINDGLMADQWQSLTDTPTVVPINANWERVCFEEILGTNTFRSFGRVIVGFP